MNLSKAPQRAYQLVLIVMILKTVAPVHAAFSSKAVEGVQSLGEDSHSNVLYFKLPSDITPDEIGKADVAIRLDAIIKEQLTNRQKEFGEERLDFIVVLTDQQGKPILPDVNRVRLNRALPVGNDLSFTFNSPTYPWSLQEQAVLNRFLNDL